MEKIKVKKMSAWEESDHLAMMRQLLKFFSAVHFIGICHRNISLETISFSCFDGRFKVGGFEVALKNSLRESAKNYFEDAKNRDCKDLALVFLSMKTMTNLFKNREITISGEQLLEDYKEIFNDG